jgi:hypothetical protein
VHWREFPPQTSWNPSGQPEYSLSTAGYAYLAGFQHAVSLRL